MKLNIKFMTKIRKATVKATGKKIEVYKLTSGGWCDYADCKTKYQENELTFE